MSIRNSGEDGPGFRYVRERQCQGNHVAGISGVKIETHRSEDCAVYEILLFNCGDLHVFLFLAVVIIHRINIRTDSLVNLSGRR